MPILLTNEFKQLPFRFAGSYHLDLWIMMGTVGTPGKPIKALAIVFCLLPHQVEKIIERFIRSVHLGHQAQLWALRLESSAVPEDIRRSMV